MKKKYILFVVALISSCASYGPQIHDRLMEIKPGMTLSEVREKYPDSAKDYNININHKSYNVLAYKYILAKSKRKQSTGAGSSRYTETVTDVYTDLYYLVFDNGKLLYYGMRYEFARHPDKTIVDISRELKITLF